MHYLKSTTVLLAILFNACAPSASNDPPLPPNATLAEKIEITRKYLGAPAAAVVVRKDGKEVLASGYGSAESPRQRAVSIDTPFRVGSISKPFIGTVVLQLAGEGKLKLDEPVSKYVSGVPDGDRITLRMLGMHTSGLYNYIASREVKKEFATHPERRWSTQELLDLSFSHKPHFSAPGDGYVYSNTNTLLLAKVIEKVTGMTTEQAVQRRICRPLGLKSTRFSTEPNAKLARGYQFGDKNGPIYWKGEGTVLHDVSTDSTTKWGVSGSLVSTARDLSVFTRALDEGKLLSPEMQAEQMRWRHCGYPIDFSYGFQLSKYKDLIGHSGQINGYQTCITYLPSQKLEITVCTNLYSSSNYEEPANWITFVIAEHFTGEKYRYNVE